MSIKPVHTHDCDCCTYLGTVMQDGTWHDLYTCRGSAIYRWGSDGPQYSSIPLRMAESMGGLYGVVSILGQ